MLRTHWFRTETPQPFCEGIIMKNRTRFRLSSQILTCALACGLLLNQSAGGEIDRDRAHEIGVQAYIYAYPMVLMEVTRQISTNVSAPTGAFAPMNQFAHLRAFPDASFREVVRPNADTLYSILWFDVSREPLVISVPDTGGRYYLLPMLDMWTDVFAVPGSRTSGTEAGQYAIVGPDFDGDLPDGVERLRCPTNRGWIIGRTQTNGSADYENVHRIQDEYQLVPLSRWGQPYAPPSKSLVDPSVDLTTPPPVQVAKMEAEAFFELFAELMKDNPPHELDWPIVTQLRQIGIVPGEDLEFSNLPSLVRSALEQAVHDALKLIEGRTGQGGISVNGWQISRDGMGTYGTSYLQRANIALVGLGANVADDAVYPMSLVDADGQPYHGRNRYVIHFDADEMPPVRGFWSLTLYTAEAYFSENPLNRYAIGDRDDHKLNADGSLDLYLQHESPGADKESNWLPAPADEFNLVLRLYWPEMPILTGDWNPPPVRRIDD